jgi:Na+/H+ antiporter NhaD/arsenite permease-like protein
MSEPNPLSVIPFALLLGTMAIAPVFAPQWWLKHYAKVALGLGAITLGYYLLGLQAYEPVLHTAHEYASFIALVGSLYVVSGGIHIGIKGQATPLKNVLFLLGGGIIANVLGTTGAAMLLIRPWIRMNQYRVAAHHIVFFIFIVANVGGCLTPIGDPPLFLGYLKGVPFWWVTQHCWPMWTVGMALLLAFFYVLDRRQQRQVPLPQPEAPAAPDAWQFSGGINLLFLAVILGAVFVEKPLFLREGLMAAAAVGSWFATAKKVHAANDFNFHPILEVVVLFAGIFSTMMPALGWLDRHATELLGQNAGPGIFYWGTGLLSSGLDNAPTYLGFLSALHNVTQTNDLPVLLGSHPAHVLAISIGAVFFGAATYIGNGPNFMVKAIAEQNRVRMPSFLEFILKFTLPALLPILITIWLLFFRG